jgi:hypothetical protein
MSVLPIVHARRHVVATEDSAMNDHHLTSILEKQQTLLRGWREEIRKNKIMSHQLHAARQTIAQLQTQLSYLSHNSIDQSASNGGGA